MPKARRAVAGHRRATTRRSPVVEAPTEVEAGRERPNKGYDPGQLPPSLLGDARLVSRLGPDQRVQALQQLQRSYGNARVARVMSPPAHPPAPASERQPLPESRDDVVRVPVQRAPATATRHHAARAENPNSYVDVLNGIQDLAVAADPSKGRDGITGRIADVTFGKRLTDKQQTLLFTLRAALTMAYTPSPGSPQAGATMLASVESGLEAAIRRAGEVGVGAEDLATTRHDLTWMSEKIIRPAAYWDAHRQAQEHSTLEAPDLVSQEQRLKDAMQDISAIEEMAVKAEKLTGQSVIDAVLNEKGMGKEIFELVENPGELREMYKELREKGGAGYVITAADLVNKALGLRNALMKVTFTVCKEYAEGQVALALGREAAEEAERWEKIAKNFGSKLKMVEEVAKVAKVITIVVSAAKIIDALAHGDWKGALKEAGNLSLSLVVAALPAEAVAAGGTVAIVAAAEIQAIHDAAAFIRWCQDETVRQAGQSFVDTCVKVAKYPAQDLVADVEAWYDPNNASIKDLIEKRLGGYAGDMRKGLAAIGAEVQCGEPGCLGGHGDLVTALGDKAKRVLLEPYAFPDDPLTMAEQIRDVFAGANAMSAYIREHYPTDRQKAADEAAKNAGKPKKSED